MQVKAAITELIQVSILALETIERLRTQPQEVQLQDDLSAQIADVHADLADLYSTVSHAPEDTWLKLAIPFEQEV